MESPNSSVVNSSALQAPEDARPLLLVVEDDADMSELLRMVLSPCYRVATAPNGIEGLNKALTLCPDLILSDLSMPEMSGDDLVRELRKQNTLGNVPIVVLTAIHDAEMRAGLLRAGAQDYITKPFTNDELLARVAHQLDVSGAQATLTAAAENINETPAPSQDLMALASQVVARQRGLETSLEVLRQSRELFHSLARNFAHASGVFFDRELRFTAEQGEGLISLGHGAKSLLGKRPSDVFLPDLAGLIEPHFRAALRGHSTTFELPLALQEQETAHDESRVLLMRALPVRDENGVITGGLAVAQDLRGHRLEEDEWQGFQARVMAQVEDAVNVIDQNHRVVYWNNAASRLYGVEAQDVLGQPLSAVYDYQWLNEGGRAAVLQELDSNGYWKGECLHRLTKDGREILVDVSISPLQEPGGESAGFLAVIRDITARKKAEEVRAHLEAERDELLTRLQSEIAETRHLRDHLNLQFERMPIGCIVWDKDFRVESWNPAATTIFGYSAEEVKGQHAFKAIVPSDVQSSVDEIWQRLLSGDNTAHSVNQNITRDGRAIVCLWSNTPLFERDGSVSGVLSMAQDITDRVQAEESLRLSEERFRSTFEKAAVGVAHIGSDGRWIQVNQKLCEILGYTQNEMLSGMRFQDITHPDDLDRNVTIFEKILHTQINSYSTEKRYLHKSGRLVWGNLTASLVENRDSEPYFIAVIEDITERKRAERTQRFLAESSSAFAASLDYEATLRTVARLCAEEVAEICIIDLFGQETEFDWPHIAAGSARRVVARHRDESKKALMYQLTGYGPNLAANLPDIEALATGRTIYLENVSDELLHRAAQDDKHLALIQSLDIKCVVITPLIVRGRVIGVAKLCNTTERSFDRHEIALIEELMRRAALARENAHLYGEAQKARHEAEEASRAKDEFLAVVSHELRTPLTPILGWVSMLRDNELASSLDAQTRLHALEAIQQSAEVQSQIIDDLLDVSRIISGNAHLHSHHIHLRNVVEAAISVARPSAKKKNIHFWTSFDPDLGLIEGDPRRLQQVVGNLLSNAIKFTPVGGRIDIQVGETSGEAGNMAQIVVSDTGIGIEREFLTRVFDRFTQADASTSRVYGGLGLGLSIVRHLVDLHNGKVEARSEGPDKGATFIVSLPLLPREIQKNGAAQPQVDAIPNSPLHWSPQGGALPRPATTTDALLGLRLLVVDDEPATRDMLSQVLVLAGADVETADSAPAARQILARWKPDVLISDIGMPGEDGYSLIKFVRALHPDDGSQVPAIALTAYARAKDRDVALKAGFQMHLAKPLTPADLIDAVLQLTQKPA